MQVTGFIANTSDVKRVSFAKMKIMISIFLIACTVERLPWVYIEDEVRIYHYHLAALFFSIVSKKIGVGDLFLLPM